MTRSVFLVVGLVLIFFLLFINRDLTVPLVLFPGLLSVPIPFYLLAFGLFLIGLVLAFFLIFPSWLKLKQENRKSKKDNGSPSAP